MNASPAPVVSTIAAWSMLAASIVVRRYDEMTLVPGAGCLHEVV